MVVTCVTYVEERGAFRCGQPLVCVGDDECCGGTHGSEIAEGAVDSQHVVSSIDEQRDIPMLFAEHRNI
jgi:hypothetical protein